MKDKAAESRADFRLVVGGFSYCIGNLGGLRMDARVNKEMVIADMLKIDPGIAAILMASGMHCVGCPSAQGESLEEAALVHGLDAEELVTSVNQYLEKK